ncbi:MAG: DUF6266 family protein [Methanococcaceae archaeon]
MGIEIGTGVSGRVGNVIYYVRKGKKCMRIRPAHVYNPKTVGQTNHRNKLKLSSRFVKALDKFIRTGYQAATVDNAGNEARQHLMKECFVITDQGPVIDFSSVIIARGEIPAPEECTISVDGNMGHITWKPGIGDRWNYVKVMVAMFIDEGKEGNSQMLSNVAYQKDGSCNVPIPLHTQPVHIWIFFSNPDLCPNEDKGKVSGSVYLGVL